MEMDDQKIIFTSILIKNMAQIESNQQQNNCTMANSTSYNPYMGAPTYCTIQDYLFVIRCTQKFLCPDIYKEEEACEYFDFIAYKALIIYSASQHIYNQFSI